MPHVKLLIKKMSTVYIFLSVTDYEIASIFSECVIEIEIQTLRFPNPLHDVLLLLKSLLQNARPVCYACHIASILLSV